VRYMCLIYLDERASEARSEAQIKAAMASHAPYIEMLRRNGRYAGSEALGPARSARTLRSSGGKPVATQGPFAESREQLGGFYVIEAADLDVAIEAASQCPALKTIGVGIEIRPIAVAGAPEGPPPASCERASHSRYLLAIYRDETAHETAQETANPAQDDEAQQAAFMQWGPYIERLRASGQFAGAEPLSPSSSATSLRLRDGKVVLTDGPFAESREHLAGYCIVWARDMDEAVGLASQCPDARQHTIEVRPVRTAALHARSP
jgi:hypothetical protein